MYIIHKDFLFHAKFIFIIGDQNMGYSFGHSVLSLYTLVDGTTLSYAYSNREVPNKVRDFQNLFRSMLVSYIENRDDSSKRFLDLCIDHIRDISDENFDFLNKINNKAGV